MIQRYDSYVHQGDNNSYMEKSHDGDYVRYEDHKAETDKLYLELEKVRNERNAAYNKGLREGRSAGEEASQPSWRL